MHTYPGFNADDLLFGKVGDGLWIVNINTKEHVAVGNLPMKSVQQLTVDPNEELIYWCDTNLNSIISAKWDGTNRRVIRQEKKCKCVCFLIWIVFSNCVESLWCSKHSHMFRFLSTYIDIVPRKWSKNIFVTDFCERNISLVQHEYRFFELRFTDPVLSAVSSTSCPQPWPTCHLHCREKRSVPSMSLFQDGEELEEGEREGRLCMVWSFPRWKLVGGGIGRGMLGVSVRVRTFSVRRFNWRLLLTSTYLHSVHAAYLAGEYVLHTVWT